MTEQPDQPKPSDSERITELERQVTTLHTELLRLRTDFGNIDRRQAADARLRALGTQ